MRPVRNAISLLSTLTLVFVAGCSRPTMPERTPPQTYSRLTFNLAVSPEESQAFRERVIQFASRYQPGGWPIGIEADEISSRAYAIDMFPDCRRQRIIIEDLVRAGAPVGRMSDYLASANSTAKCVDGLKLKKST